MLSMRLMRFGSKKKPSYRVVVLDSRSPRQGKALDFLGVYDPMKEPAEVSIDYRKAKSWLEKGAQASRTVQSLLEKAAQSEKASA